MVSRRTVPKALIQADVRFDTHLIQLANLIESSFEFDLIQNNPLILSLLREMVKTMNAYIYLV